MPGEVLAVTGELLHALAFVGRAGWLQGLHEGLSTCNEASTGSGGEPRRLLLARALLAGSRVMPLDDRGAPGR